MNVKIESPVSLVCSKCHGDMMLKELPYLTAPTGVARNADGTVNATDTGLKIQVWICEMCGHTVLPPGSRPYSPTVVQ